MSSSPLCLTANCSWFAQCVSDFAASHLFPDPQVRLCSLICAVQILHSLCFCFTWFSCLFSDLCLVTFVRFMDLLSDYWDFAMCLPQRTVLFRFTCQSEFCMFIPARVCCLWLKVFLVVCLWVLPALYLICLVHHHICKTQWIGLQFSVNKKKHVCIQ